MHMSFDVTLQELRIWDIPKPTKGRIQSILKGIGEINRSYTAGDELTEAIPDQLVEFVNWLDEEYFATGGEISTDMSRLFHGLAAGLYSMQNRVKFWTDITDGFIRCRKVDDKYVYLNKKLSGFCKPGEFLRFAEATCMIASFPKEMVVHFISQLMRVAASYPESASDISQELERYGHRYTLEDFYQVATATSRLEPTEEFPYRSKDKAGKVLMHTILRFRTKDEDPFEMIRKIKEIPYSLPV